MVLKGINEIALAGYMTSDTVIRAEIERQIILRKAKTLSVADKLLPSMNFGVLDVKYSYSSDMTGEYPVPENKIASFEDIEWTTYNTTLEKAQVRYGMSDEANIRQLRDVQEQNGQIKAARALAVLLNNHVVDTIVTGGQYANNIISVAADAQWDSGEVEADPEADITDAIGKIMTYSRLEDMDLEGGVEVNLLYPATAWAALRKLNLIGNVQQSYKKYFQETFNLGMYATRYSSVIDSTITGIGRDAYVIVKVQEAGLTGHFVPPPGKAIPMVESRRNFGTGEEKLFTNYFKTKITPESSSETSTTYIAKIDNAVMA